MMSQADEERVIIEYLAKVTAKAPEGSWRDRPLFQSGVLDSIEFMRLISFLEKKFSIHFLSSDLKNENFDTVEKIVGLVRLKRAGK